MGSVLVVDDERSMREFLAICLKRQGHEVSVADSGEAAAEFLATRDVDVVVTDLRMPGGMSGLDLLGRIRDGKHNAEVIVVTAHGTTETAIAAMKRGAYDYLTKPFKIDDIEAVIGRALEKRALVAENAALREEVASRYRLASLIGKSAGMQRVFALIRKVAPTRASVLITGESGTGKELCARALHSEGEREGGPFVAVNCGAIPEELMESELFGHLRGAFTGAVADKVGLFEEARGGTLFLDEIGELSQKLQVKLLRALQERRIKPVGATREVETDVRVIAATNRDLEREVQSGAFRSDLFYRLNVIEIRLPPLRGRREDIPLLADKFLRRFAAEQGRRIRGLSPAALRKLSDHDFPGNVRELENILERAVTLADGPEIEPDDLPELSCKAATAGFSADAIDFPEGGVDIDRLIADYERAIVAKALETAGGVRTQAAKLLGISFRSLRYRLDKLGLD